MGQVGCAYVFSSIPFKQIYSLDCIQDVVYGRMPAATLSNGTQRTQKLDRLASVEFRFALFVHLLNHHGSLTFTCPNYRTLLVPESGKSLSC